MADITLQHIVETIRKPSYIAFLKQPLALGVISNEFKEDEFFQKEEFQNKKDGEDPIIEFFIENLTKLYKGENIDNPEDNDKLEEFLVFTVLQHDKQQEALKEEEKQELAENARKFQESMEKQDREDNPLYFAFKDAKDKTIEELKSKIGEMPNIQNIANRTKAKLSEGFDAAKQTLSDVQSKGMDTAKQTISDVSTKAKNLMGSMGSVGSMFGKKPEEPVPVNGGKRKSKKQRKSKKGGKRKSKKNKSKKNKSKKSKK
tara:strand:- start:3613 stop:4389 length:777 start_codon:yes stop_codon:yes gene_type:complete